LAASDYAQAAGLIEQVGTTLLWQRAETATLLRWLEQLPRDAARARPRLCLDLAWALLWDDQVDSIESWLRVAVQALDTLDTAAPSTNPSLDAFSRALRGMTQRLAAHRMDCREPPQAASAEGGVETSSKDGVQLRGCDE
jgi:ATP/maltotriose-dependent transcriptional regulator MalT